MMLPMILKAVLLFGTTAQALAVPASYSTATSAPSSLSGDSISQTLDKIETSEANLADADFSVVDGDIDEDTPLISRELGDDNLDAFYQSDVFDEGQDELITSPSRFSSSPIDNAALSKRGWKKWWRELWEAKPVYRCSDDGTDC